MDRSSWNGMTQYMATLSPEKIARRKAFYHRRFASALHEIISRDSITEDREVEMVYKVNLEESLNRLRICPVCTSQIALYPDYPLERVCTNGCGTFTISDVWTNGDVQITFTMAALAQEQDPVADLGRAPDADPSADVRV